MFALKFHIIVTRLPITGYHLYFYLKTVEFILLTYRLSRDMLT